MSTKELNPDASGSEKIDALIRKSNDWDDDRVAAAEKQAKDDRRSKHIAWALAFLVALSNVFVWPLKETRWVTVLVDLVNGSTEVRQTVMTDAKTTYPEVVDQYWVKKYVTQREGFTFDEFDSIYRTVGLLSSSQEQQAWAAYFRKENPESPVARYGDRKKVRVKIVSFSYIDKEKHIASVRFIKTTEEPNAEPVRESRIATVKFRFVNPPTKDEDREINPIGYQTTDYRTDREAIVGVYEGAK